MQSLLVDKQQNIRDLKTPKGNWGVQHNSQEDHGTG